MRLLTLWLFVACLATFAPGQDIPNGVRYKKATDSVNKLAFDALTKLLTADPEKADPTGISGDAMICGPGLWHVLEPSAPDILKNALLINFIVPTPGGTQKLIGRGLKTPEQIAAFWKQYLKLYGGQKELVLRKANAEEISYYWAIIPYDIEEPLYVAVVGKQSLLFNFVVEDGVPKILHIDIVMKAA